MIQTFSLEQARLGAGRTGHWLQRPIVRYGGIAALGVALVVSMIVLTLPHPTTTTSGTTSGSRTTVVGQLAITTPSPTLAPPEITPFTLPAFSDWRVAYLAPGGAVHVSSLDGKTDLTGPVLNISVADTTNGAAPWVSPYTAQSYTSLSVAPNGRFLAYIDAAPRPAGAGVAPPNGPLGLINLAPDGPTRDGWSSASIAANVTHLAGWSPDSTHLAMEATVNNVQGVYVVGPTDAAPTLISTTNDNGPLAQSHAIGWLDNTHVLLMTTGGGSALLPVSSQSTPVSSGNVPGNSALTSRLTAPRSSNGDFSLATVDIVTGEAFEITRVPGTAVVALSPDGKEIEASSGCTGACTSLPPEVVDTATGLIHQLPNSSPSIMLQVMAMWQPGTANLAVAIASASTATTWQTWLVDTQHDSARQLRPDVYTIAWSPDGQYLLLGDEVTLQKDHNQTYMDVVSPSGAAAPAMIPHQMAAFIGFVKTA